MRRFWLLVLSAILLGLTVWSRFILSASVDVQSPPPKQGITTSASGRPADVQDARLVSAPTPDMLAAFAPPVRRSGRNIVGLYSPGGLELRVDQQHGDPLYVNANWGWASQFGLASQYGSIGLLAHNFLSGSAFSEIVVGQELDAVYGDGAVRRYTVHAVRRFQALNPRDPYSELVDLDSGDRLSSTATFLQVYTGDRLVLQTCITENGDPTWGRLFVIATPS